MSDGMKIAFISDVAFPWHAGGVEQTERLEAEYLARRHEVHFFSFMWRGMGREFTDKGIRYHASHRITDAQLYRHKRRSMREALRLSAMAWRLFSDRFDIVQANAFPYLHLPVVKLYCRVTGARLIVDVAEVWDAGVWRDYLGPVLGPLMWRYTNWTLRGADAYISNPGRAYEGLIAMGVQRAKIHQFTPILDDRLISGIRAKERRGLVVYLGRLVKEKRLDKWLDAVGDAAIINKSLRGMIVGDGPERETIRRSISRLGLGRTVTLRGRIRERKEAYRLLKGAALFLNMSEREGLSATSLESLALGTPVLLPDYSPIPEAVKQMCVVSDIDELPAAIAKISGSASKRKFIRNAGGLESFSASGIPQFYKRLLAKLR